MEHTHIKSFRVENFKRFENLEINNIGQFNLFVGDNNIGKTSVLESMLADNKLADYLSDIETLFEWRKLEGIATNNFNYFNLLFHSWANNKIGFKYEYTNGTGVKNYLYEVVEFESLSQSDLQHLKKKTISNINSKFVIKQFINNQFNDISFLTGFANQTSDTYLPFIPFNMGTDDLTDYYSAKFQNSRSKRKDLIQSLKTFIQGIEDLEISSGIIPNQNTLSIWIENFENPIIINSFGEGTVKTLRILLEISECENKRLSIDEIDTGIHYSRLPQFWETILQSSLTNNTQIFATTHSKECLIYFKEALSKLKIQDKARVIRLIQNKESRVNSYTYNFEQFEQSLDFENEIR